MAAAVLNTLERATKQLGFCLRTLKAANVKTAHQKNLAGALQTLLTASRALASLRTNSVVTLDLATLLRDATPSRTGVSSSRDNTPSRTEVSLLTSNTPSRTQVSSARNSTPSRAGVSSSRSNTSCRTEVSSARSASPSRTRVPSSRSYTPSRTEVSPSTGNSPSRTQVSSARNFTPRTVVSASRNNTPSRTEVSPLTHSTPSRTRVSSPRKPTPSSATADAQASPCPCCAHDLKGAYEKLLSKFEATNEKNGDRAPAVVVLEEFLEKKSLLPGCQGERARLLLRHARDSRKPRKLLRAKRSLAKASASVDNAGVAASGTDNTADLLQPAENDVIALLSIGSITLKTYHFLKASKPL
eukprot:TRINITY_DN14361_c0_g2_i1.p2 TRINITY_DN14361_c0_g2~~TRINITY_DN14361_c0_g2_i1.p2  ORF type:complete len:357 (+),score=35.61 TRINITY_DN14361_c0_g2_i1:131-1201(+)